MLGCHGHHDKSLLFSVLFHTQLRCVFSPLLPHCYREMLLATSNRKSKNVWMELLQEQNPDLLPPQHDEDESAKPAYIQRMRLEKAQRENGHAVSSCLPGSLQRRQSSKPHQSRTRRSFSLPGTGLRSLRHSFHLPLHARKSDPGTSATTVRPAAHPRSTSVPHNATQPQRSPHHKA